MTVVELGRTEVLHGALAGITRRCKSIGWASTDYVNGGMEPWDRDIEAACAEVAVAKALGWYYDYSVGRYCGQGGDVLDLQVRWTKYPDGRLVIRTRDDDNATYVLVTGAAPAFTIVGWITGADAKVAEWLSDPGGRGLECWMVPQSALRPLQQAA